MFTGPKAFFESRSHNRFGVIQITADQDYLVANECLPWHFRLPESHKGGCISATALRVQDSKNFESLTGGLARNLSQNKQKSHCLNSKNQKNAMRHCSARVLRRPRHSLRVSSRAAARPTDRSPHPAASQSPCHRAPRSPKHPCTSRPRATERSECAAPSD